MKQKLHPSSKLRAVFCSGLAVVLAAGLALNSAAADAEPVRYDVKVASSATHTAALSGGDLYFWGTNEWGQIPGLENVYTAEPRHALSGVADVAVSSKRSLVVGDSGELRFFGLDPANKTTSGSAGKVLAQDAAQVAASDTFAAYVSKAGALYTWGRNDSGQLGNGNSVATDTPVRVLQSGVTKVSLGDSFALALTEDGTVYGWGANDCLQLGSAGLGEAVSSPRVVASDVADISAGYTHALLLKTNGTVWACGDNTYSQTGADSSEHSNEWTQVFTGARSISAGAFHNFAVSNDGTVYAWGYGQSGQLGNGTSQRYVSPTATALEYVQVFAGNDSTFGISKDGSIYSFGSNTNYLLGKAEGSDSLLPMQILNKDMEWVYEEYLQSAEYLATVENNPGHADSNWLLADPEENESASEAESGAGNGTAAGSDETEPAVTPVLEPEVVATPFVNGDGNGFFRPGDNVTRAEFLKMLVVALCSDFDETADYGSAPFSDLAPGRWYESYLAYAWKNELVAGYKDGTFHPDDPITRAEASVMAAKVMGLDTDSAVPSKFSDVPEGWSAAYIDALSAEGILTGDGDGKFRPSDDISRKEAVTLVAKAVGFQPDTQKQTELQQAYAQVSPFTDVPASAWYYPYLLRAVGYEK